LTKEAEILIARAFVIALTRLKLLQHAQKPQLWPDKKNQLGPGFTQRKILFD
jgi:hypothetical protein